MLEGDSPLRSSVVRFLMECDEAVAMRKDGHLNPLFAHPSVRAVYRRMDRSGRPIDRPTDGFTYQPITLCRPTDRLSHRPTDRLLYPAPTLALVKALLIAHDEDSDPVFWPNPGG